jgi:hypothetical protein
MWFSVFVQETLAEISRPPTLAQLAQEGKFYAVLNLIRRVKTVVQVEEYDFEYCGKTAADWAVSNNADDLAIEIRYRMSSAMRVSENSLWNIDI